MYWIILYRVWADLSTAVGCSGWWRDGLPLGSGEARPSKNILFCQKDLFINAQHLENLVWSWWINNMWKDFFSQETGGRPYITIGCVLTGLHSYTCILALCLLLMLLIRISWSIYSNCRPRYIIVQNIKYNIYKMYNKFSFYSIVVVQSTDYCRYICILSGTLLDNNIASHV